MADLRDLRSLQQQLKTAKMALSHVSATSTEYVGIADNINNLKRLINRFLFTMNFNLDGNVDKFKMPPLHFQRCKM